MARVADIMRSEVITIRRGASVGDLARLLDQEEISGAPVVDRDGTVLGVVSRADLVRALARAPELGGEQEFWEALGRELPTAIDDDPEAYFLAPEGTRIALPGSLALEGGGLEETPVENLMTPVAFSVPPDMSLRDLSGFLVRGGIHRALVVDGGVLVGIVTAFDVLRHHAERDEA